MLKLSIFYIVLGAVSLQNFVLLNDCIVAHVLHKFILTIKLPRNNLPNVNFCNNW